MRKCGDDAFEYLYSSGRDILIEFETDGTVTDEGFHIVYYQVCKHTLSL